jgi:hypothetical protein
VIKEKKAMKNTMLFRPAKRQNSLAKFHLLAVAGVAAILSLTTVAPKANAQVLPNRTLVNTWFAANNVPVNANCAPAGCVSPNVPLFPVLPIVCPGAVGATCTFYIHLETNDTLTISDKGRFQFLVGGVAPNPGPTAGVGYFVWDNHDPNSAIAVPFSHSYAVTAVVTNNAPNQAWPVTVSVSCVDNGGTPAGCTAVTQLSNLEVGVYMP